jgi:hypothetical protein
MRFEIDFRPACEQPTRPLGEKGGYRAALILNPCDGYHHVFARWWEDGSFHGFTNWADWDAFEPGKHFTAWALLPDEQALIEDMAVLQSDTK